VGDLLVANRNGRSCCEGHGLYFKFHVDIEYLTGWDFRISKAENTPNAGWDEGSCSATAHLRTRGKTFSHRKHSGPRSLKEDAHRRMLGGSVCLLLIVQDREVGFSSSRNFQICCGWPKGKDVSFGTEQPKICSGVTGSRKPAPLL
jgi:hypothetical protein